MSGARIVAASIVYRWNPVRSSFLTSSEETEGELMVNPIDAVGGRKAKRASGADGSATLSSARGGEGVAPASAIDASFRPSEATLVDLYRVVLLSRTLDDAEVRLRRQGKAFFQISSAGHEVIQAVAASVFRAGSDWFYLYYRDRCLSLGLGMEPLDLVRQALAKRTDLMSGGREMPCHFGIPSLRIINQSSATGSQFLHAVGTAEGIWLARQGGVSPGPLPEKFLRGRARTGEAQTLVDPCRVEEDEIVLTTGGDGATSEGEFYEAISAACLRRLPVLFLIQDNAYAISVPVEYQTPGGSISRLFKEYPGLHVQEVDGLDPVASYTVLSHAAQYVRDGRGPALVHAHVSRLVPHSDADDDKLYRPDVERDLIRRRDPLPRFASLLVERGILSRGEIAELEKKTEAEVAAAVEIALGEDDPEPTPEEVTRFLFESNPVVEEETPPATVGDELTLLDAIRRTLRTEMEQDPRILVFGEDVADLSRAHLLEQLPGKGGVFRVTHGLQREFGHERVFNTPIAEAAIIGRALGLAVRGFLPVPEIQFFDYIWPAMHQIRNELTVLRWRSYDNFAAPVVIRAPIGGYLRGGAIYHSQSAETMFCACPGLRVVMPSNARDAVGLLRTSLRSGDPVLFLEHKHLYRQPYAKSIDPGPDYVIPFGCARVAREGSDVSVVTYGALVEKSLSAARRLADEGIEVEVIDLRSLQPYDFAAIRASVEKTNRVVVAGEEPRTHGFAAEVAARIADELFEHLDAPVRRVGALDAPVPYSPVLEHCMLPSEEDLLREVRSVRAF